MKALVLALALTGGMERPCPAPLPDCSREFGYAYEQCAAHVVELMMWNMECAPQQQMYLPQQEALPNTPIQVVESRGTSIGEWAALLGGIGTLLAGLVAWRHRRTP